MDPRRYTAMNLKNQNTYQGYRSAIIVNKLIEVRDDADERQLADLYVGICDHVHHASLKIHFLKKAIKHFKHIKDRTGNDSVHLADAYLSLARHYDKWTKPEITMAALRKGMDVCLQALEGIHQPIAGAEHSFADRIYLIISQITGLAKYDEPFLVILTGLKEKSTIMRHALGRMLIDQAVALSNTSPNEAYPFCLRAINVLSVLGSDNGLKTLMQACSLKDQLKEEMNNPLKVKPIAEISPQTTKVHGLFAQRVESDKGLVQVESVVEKEKNHAPG